MERDQMRRGALEKDGEAMSEDRFTAGHSALRGVHHVAYRCRDAKETVEFYARSCSAWSSPLAIAENEVPSTGARIPTCTSSSTPANGNVLAFFELPNSPEMGRDGNTPEWVQHIAFRVESLEVLEETRRRLEAAGLDVLGPVDHGIFQSIYFFDPNGHRLELAANTATAEDLQRLKDVAPEMLEEWSRTKRAPRHAAWLHERVNARRAAEREGASA
jgi:glyoxylase I family protein